MTKLDIEKTFDLGQDVVSELDMEQVQYVNKRQGKMDDERSNEATKWDIWETNVRSPIYDMED